MKGSEILQTLIQDKLIKLFACKLTLYDRVDFMISEQSKWREMKKNWSAKMREMEKANDSLKVSVEKLEKDKRFLENEKDMLVNRKK